uniref:Uncharacterized protein n=1 Tax=Amphimedon queenslandica TaxID=400682 RepID=A0A1X7V8A7_AMPQE
MSNYYKISSMVLLNLLLLLQSSYNAASAAPLNLLPNAVHMMERRSLGQCAKIHALTNHGAMPVAIGKDEELMKNGQGDIFRILDVNAGNPELTSKVVNIQSLKHDTYLAVTSAGEVTTVSHDVFNEEGSGSGLQYFSNFTLQPIDGGHAVQGLYKMLALRDDTLGDCVVSFNEEPPSCKKDDSTHLSFVLIDNVQCSQES